MNRSQLREMLKRHERLSLKPYKDAVGKTTIGYGRNLEDLGITQEEAEILLECDIARVLVECQSNIPCFGSLDTARQHVLCDMDFNLGISKLLKFTQMLKCLESRDFDGAAKEMRDSKWFLQVGSRGEELVEMMKKG